MSNGDDRVLRLARGQDAVVTRRQALAAGLSDRQIERRVAGGSWRALCRGIYLVTSVGSAPAAYDGVPPRAAWRAGVLAGGARAVLGYHSAALAHQLPVEPPPASGVAAVDVVLPGRRRPSQRSASAGRFPVALRWHWTALPPDHITRVAGLPVTSLVRTARDVLPVMRHAAAVCLADAVLRRGCPAELLRLPGRGRSARVVDTVLSLADGRSESPLETRCRVLLHEAGLPPDELQYPVAESSGQVLARADLAWVRPGGVLIVECDGAAFHGSPQAVHRDRYRQNDLVLAGCRVVRFTWRDVHHPGYVVGVVRRALREMERTVET